MIRRISRGIVFLIFLAAAQPGLTKKHRQHVIKEGDTPAKVAKQYNVPTDELLRYNDLKPDGAFRVGHKLTIPFPGEVTGAKYTVRPGDSVARIADFHGVSQNHLRTANGLKEGDALQPGQVLAIPYEMRGDAVAGHVVKKGDTLAAIAKRHKVTIKALAAANKMTPNSTLQLGRKILIPDSEDDSGRPFRPQKVNKLVKTGELVNGGVRHEVQPGQSLWIIARAYNTSGKRIAKANGITTRTPINVGSKILIPGAKAVVPVRVRGYTVQKVHILNLWADESAQIRLLTNHGKVNQRSRRILSKLARAKRKKKNAVKLLHPRLLHLLQRVVERFPGKSIEIISGYRPRKRGQRLSKHNQGRALDFRIRGVSNKELFDFIKELPKVGAGYYPNSVFVHMDTRKRKALWTDYSGQGEKAMYAHKGAVNPEAAADSAQPPPLQAAPAQAQEAPPASSAKIAE